MDIMGLSNMSVLEGFTCTSLTGQFQSNTKAQESVRIATKVSAAYRNNFSPNFNFSSRTATRVVQGQSRILSSSSYLRTFIGEENVEGKIKCLHRELIILPTSQLGDGKSSAYQSRSIGLADKDH